MFSDVAWAKPSTGFNVFLKRTLLGPERGSSESRAGSSTRELVDALTVTEVEDLVAFIGLAGALAFLLRVVLVFVGRAAADLGLVSDSVTMVGDFDLSALSVVRFLRGLPFLFAAAESWVELSVESILVRATTGSGIEFVMLDSGFLPVWLPIDFLSIFDVIATSFGSASTSGARGGTSSCGFFLKATLFLGFVTCVIDLRFFLGLDLVVCSVTAVARLDTMLVGFVRLSPSKAGSGSSSAKLRLLVLRIALEDFTGSRACWGSLIGFLGEELIVLSNSSLTRSEVE